MSDSPNGGRPQGHAGRIAYDAYCEARNWESFKGDPLPPFEAQSPELQDAWHQAAEAVINATLADVSDQGACAQPPRISKSELP